MTKIILGLVGPLASGKGTMKKYIVEKYSGEECRFSTILRDILNRVNVSISRENLQNLSTILRQNFGEDVLAKAITKDAQNFTADIVVVDGVRRMTDIAYLTEALNFYLVAVDAETKTRYERLKMRNENAGDDQKTYEQFLSDQEAEAEKEIPLVMNRANFHIVNNGNLLALYAQIDEIISQVNTK